MGYFQTWIWFLKKNGLLIHVKLCQRHSFSRSESENEIAGDREREMKMKKILQKRESRWWLWLWQRLTMIGLGSDKSMHWMILLGKILKSKDLLVQTQTKSARPEKNWNEGESNWKMAAPLLDWLDISKFFPSNKFGNVCNDRWFGYFRLTTYSNKIENGCINRSIGCFQLIFQINWITGKWLHHWKMINHLISYS